MITKEKREKWNEEVDKFLLYLGEKVKEENNHPVISQWKLPNKPGYTVRIDFNGGAENANEKIEDCKRKLKERKIKE